VNASLKELEPTLKTQENKIESLKAEASRLKEQINKVEDDLFAAFCKKVGVKNIREYEEERLTAIRERNDKKVKIAKHVSILRNQIEYEAGRDVKGPLDKLKESIEADKAKLQQLDERNEELAGKNTEFEQELNELKEKQNQAKAKVDELEISIKEIKKQLASVEKDIVAVQKRISVTETQLHQLRARRHNLYRQARVEEIRLPLLSSKKAKAKKGVKKGKSKKRTREQEEEEGEEEEEEEEDASLSIMDIDTEPPSIDTMNSESTQAVESLHAEDKITLDFSSVEEHETETPKEYDEKNAQMLRQMQDMEAEMAKLAPNLKAVQRLDDVDTRLKETNEELEAVRKSAKDESDKFEEIKKKRNDLFMEAFNAISRAINHIYQELTRSALNPNLHGTAYLHVENQDEPYLGGIKYTTMPPMKQFRDMEQLSGGEKTVAALALLFAAHKHRPSPFFILDEVDAALDPSNVQLVARYIRARAKEDAKKDSASPCQFIVISLKDTFYDKSFSLVGICREVREASSRPFTLDLTPYPE
jgi:structural maintenance of chromosome 1